MVEHAEGIPPTSLAPGRLPEVEDYVAVPSCESDALSESLPTTPSTTALVDDPFTNVDPQEDVVRDADFYRLADYVELRVSVLSVINKARPADLCPQIDNTLFRIDSHLFQHQSDSAHMFIHQAAAGGTGLSLSAIDFARFLKIADCR
jgi:hypothetical protein